MFLQCFQLTKSYFLSKEEQSISTHPIGTINVGRPIKTWLRMAWNRGRGNYAQEGYSGFQVKGMIEELFWV